MREGLAQASSEFVRLFRPQRMPNHRIEVWAPNWGPHLRLPCLGAVESMGPQYEMVCRGYLVVSDQGPILRAHGLISQRSDEALGIFLLLLEYNHKQFLNIMCLSEV